MPLPDRRTILIAGGSCVVAAGLGAAWAMGGDRSHGDALGPAAAHAAADGGGILLLDVRRPEEWRETGIPAGARPLDMRRDDFVGEVMAMVGGDRDRPVALICAGGVRSDRTGARLAGAGFTRVIDVPEGVEGSPAGPGWLARGLPVVRP